MADTGVALGTKHLIRHRIGSALSRGFITRCLARRWILERIPWSDPVLIMHAREVDIDRHDERILSRQYSSLDEWELERMGLY